MIRPYSVWKPQMGRLVGNRQNGSARDHRLLYFMVIVRSCLRRHWSRGFDFRRKYQLCVFSDVKKISTSMITLMVWEAFVPTFAVFIVAETRFCLTFFSHMTACWRISLELATNNVYLMLTGFVFVSLSLYTPPTLNSMLLNFELNSKPPMAYLKYPTPRSSFSSKGIHKTVAIGATTSMYKVENSLILIAWDCPGIPITSNLWESLALIVSKFPP